MAKKGLAELGFFPPTDKNKQTTAHEGYVFEHPTAGRVVVYSSPGDKTTSVQAVLRDARQKLLRDRARKSNQT